MIRQRVGRGRSANVADVAAVPDTFAAALDECAYDRGILMLKVPTKILFAAIGGLAACAPGALAGSPTLAPSAAMNAGESATAPIDADAPQLQVSASAISASAPSHGSATSAVRIGNGGAGRLDWSAATAPLSAADAGKRRADDDIERAFYTFDLYNDFSGPGYGQLVRFSPENTTYAIPDEALIVRNDDGRIIFDAAFADDDFSTLYAIDLNSNELLRWHDVDQPYPASPYDVVGTIPLPGENITGLRQDPTSGVMYLTTSDGSDSALWILDLASLAVDPVGAMDGAFVDDIAFDTLGQLYGIDEALAAVIAIDKHTAQWTPIGSLGIQSSHISSALDFDAVTGQLYLLTIAQINASQDGEFLYTIDLATGNAQEPSQVIGIDDSFVYWSTLAIAHRMSACTAPQTIPWLSVSPADGSVDGGDPAQTLTIAFDGAALADGVHEANLCVYSNDPLQRRLSIPVRFELGGDNIFLGGFDGEP